MIMEYVLIKSQAKGYCCLMEREYVDYCLTLTVKCSIISKNNADLHIRTKTIILPYYSNDNYMI